VVSAVSSMWRTNSFAALLAGAPGFRGVRPLSFRRFEVLNVTDPDAIDARGDGRRQDPTAAGLIRFRSEIAPLLRPDSALLETVAALRHWARTQQSIERALWIFPPSDESGELDPELLLHQQRAGQPGACRRFGYVLAGALLSAGIPARIVSLQASLTDTLGHIMVEAWIEGDNKWVLVDPTNDTMFEVDGRFASLLELRRALLAGGPNSIRFERHGSHLEPSPRIEYFLQIARHAFVIVDECLFTDPPLQKRDAWRFRVLHYVDTHAERYPRFAQLASTAVRWTFG